MLNLLRPAALLIALVTLDSSLASAQAAKAGVVTTLEGNVNVTRVTLAPQPLKFKDAVFVNDRVTTGDQSIARMLLGGNAVVTVRERSTLTITEVPGKTTIDLDAGKIALAVARDRMNAGESIEVRTANAVAGVGGTGLGREGWRRSGEGERAQQRNHGRELVHGRGRARGPERRAATGYPESADSAGRQPRL